MKRLLATAICLIMVAAMFGGCAAADNTTAAGTTSGATTSGETTTGATTTAAQGGDEEAVEITFWFYPLWGEAETVYGEDFPAKVKELYPHITVKYEMLSWDAGPEKFTVSMATGATPDIYYDTFSRCAPAINADLLVDLTDVAEEIKPYTYETEHSGVKDGKNMALTFHNNSGYGVSVNTTLAERLGITDMLPTDRLHWSYDDFLDICRAAKAADSSIAPISLYAGSRSSDAWYYSWIMSGGADILNDSLTEMTVNTPEAAATLNVFKTLIDEGLCSPGAATLKDEDIEPIFFSQQSLFYSSGAFNNMVNVQALIDSGDIEPFEFDFYAIPTPDGASDPRVVTFGAVSLILFKNENDAAKIDAAKKAIKVLYEYPEFAKAQGNGTGIATIVKAATPDYATPKLTELAIWNVDYTNKYATSEFGILEPWWSDFRETFYIELQGLYTGSQTAEELLQNWSVSGNAVIAAAQQ